MTSQSGQNLISSVSDRFLYKWIRTKREGVFFPETFRISFHRGDTCWCIKDMKKWILHNRWPLISIGMSAVALIMWIDFKGNSSEEWCNYLTLSSGNNEEALPQCFCFTLTIYIASNAVRGCFLHVLWKMIENLPGCTEWVEVSFCETAVWEVLVFPQEVSRGFPSPLTAVNQHHRAADGRLCLAGAHILGAYCCP